MSFTIKIILGLFIFISSIYNANSGEDNNRITILAPSNMSLSLSEIIKNYSLHNKIIVSASYDNIYNQISNIEQGVAADIIITNDSSWIKNLKQKGLIDLSSIENIVEDKFVLITSLDTKNNHENVFNKNNKNLKKQLFKNLTMVIPSDITGKYANDIIANNNDFEYIKTITINDPSITNYILKNQNSIAISLYTDTYDNNNIAIIDDFSNKGYFRPIYQAAAIAGSNIAQSRKLINFLKSNQSQIIFKKYGFSINNDDK